MKEFKKECKKEHKEWCCNEDDIFECLCELDKELECIKKSCGHKHLTHVTKEKVLTCILLREIDKLEKKLDKILRELDCGWDSDSDSNSDCD